MHKTRKTEKGRRKNKQRKKRRAEGNTIVELVAGFLNIDMQLAGDIKDKWHLYGVLLRGGQVDLSAKEVGRYMELKPLVGLLSERDTRDPSLMEQLAKLQEDVKRVLSPLFVQPSWIEFLDTKKREEEISKRQRIRGGMQGLINRVNRRGFSSQLALYSQGEISGHGWVCSHDPENPNESTDADPALLTLRRAIKIGHYQYVVMETFPRVGSSISDRLYWRIRQTLTDGTIGTLKICSECGKYFAAHDTKQVFCRMECYLSRNAKDSAARVKKYRAKKATMMQRH